MRKVIAVAAIGLGLAWGGVQAENKKLPTEKERLELCSSAEKLASSIMKARQKSLVMNCALDGKSTGTVTGINQVWSMDFMHDQFADGQSIRLFNVVDGFNREG